MRATATDDFLNIRPRIGDTGLASLQRTRGRLGRAEAAEPDHRHAFECDVLDATTSATIEQSAAHQTTEVGNNLHLAAVDVDIDPGRPLPTRREAGGAPSCSCRLR